MDENNGLSEYCMGCACFYGYDMEIRRESGFNLIKNAAYLGDVEAKKLLSDVFINNIWIGKMNTGTALIE